MRKISYLIVLIVLISASPWAAAGSYTDFFRAIATDDTAAVQALLAKGFDPNAVDARGNSALYLALKDKSFDVANVLIAQPKLNLNQLNPSDENALMIACLEGDDDLVEKMVARGAEINKPGWTPLAYAATNGHTRIVKYLLDHAAYIDAAAPNGTTALMMAAYFGHDATVKLLLEEGADPGLKNAMGFTALDLATQRGHMAAAKLIAHAIAMDRQSGHW
ncbi:MAG: ankyrin repeat domain-containing protein [Thiomonas delicata]